MDRTETTAGTTAAARIAFSELIDDAGLFPPARLPMKRAVEAHVAGEAGPHGWIMGRFMCPADALGELAATMSGSAKWRVGVLVGGPGAPWPEGAGSGLTEASSFERATGSLVEVVETRVPDEALDNDFERALERFTTMLEAAGLQHVVAFFEISPMVDSIALRHTLDSIRKAGLGAKVRCGGFSREEFPSPEALGGFIWACIGAGVPFKATQGLHRPFRHFDPEVGADRHGFVNILAATAIGVDADEESVVRIVSETDPDSFRLQPDGLTWRDLTAGPGALAAARRLFRSYGSCDFDEPVEALAAAGLLPEDG